MRWIILFVLLVCTRGYSMQVSTALDIKLKAAGIPIDGVSIKNPADKSTWRIDYQASATAQHRTQAAQIVAAFDIVADTVDPKTDTQKAQEELAALKARIETLEKK